LILCFCLQSSSCSVNMTITNRWKFEVNLKIKKTYAALVSRLSKSSFFIEKWRCIWEDIFSGRRQLFDSISVFIHSYTLKKRCIIRWSHSLMTQKLSSKSSDICHKQQWRGLLFWLLRGRFKNVKKSFGLWKETLDLCSYKLEVFHSAH